MLSFFGKMRGLVSEAPLIAGSSKQKKCSDAPYIKARSTVRLCGVIKIMLNLKKRERRTEKRKENRNVAFAA